MKTNGFPFNKVTVSRTYHWIPADHPVLEVLEPHLFLEVPGVLEAPLSLLLPEAQTDLADLENQNPFPPTTTETPNSKQSSRRHVYQGPLSC